LSFKSNNILGSGRLPLLFYMILPHKLEELLVTSNEFLYPDEDLYLKKTFVLLLLLRKGRFSL
jgi:hypothetical protein